MLLDERPMHGYELITEMTERSNGRWQPSPGTIYPALGRMAEHGLVEATDVDGKRRYSLTDRGRTRLDQYRSERGADAGAPWDDPGTGRRGDLRGRLAELAGQVRQIGRFGTGEQTQQAADVLRDATRRLYAILATEPEPEPEPEPEETVADDAEPDASTTDAAG
jgi:DNA-binding PadR family transcriptional regulator